MRPLDLAAGIAVTITWGCNFSVIEAGLQSLDPLAMTFLRFLFCAVPAVFLIRRPREVAVRYLVLYGALFGAGMWGVVNVAIHIGLSPGLAAIFLQFSAFITTILCRILFGEALNPVHVAGMMLSCAGLLGLVLLAGESMPLLGLALVLLAAVAWAVCNVIVKRARPPDMVAFIVWSSTVSAPSVLLLTLLLEGTAPIVAIRDVSASGMLSVLFQAYVTTIVGYGIWNNLMKRYPAPEVAPLSLLVPIAGLVSSYLFFGETLSPVQIAVVILVLLGLALFINASRFGRILRII